MNTAIEVADVGADGDDEEPNRKSWDEAANVSSKPTLKAETQFL